MMVTRYLLAGLVVLLQLLDLSVGLPAADFVSVAVRFVDSETIQLQDGTVFHSERSLAQPTEQRTLRRGEGGDEEVSPINIVLTVSCVLMAALAAGLTMGLVSLDVDDIELAIAQGEIAEKPEVPGVHCCRCCCCFLPGVHFCRCCCFHHAVASCASVRAPCIPMLRRWRHREGTRCAGSIRAARADRGQGNT